MVLQCCTAAVHMSEAFERSKNTVFVVVKGCKKILDCSYQLRLTGVSGVKAMIKVCKDVVFGQVKMW